MGNTQWGQLLELKTGHENRIAVLASALQASQTRLERAEFARQALETELRMLQRAMAHLRGGDGSLILCEHTADGVTQAFYPTVAVMRDALLADADRVAAEQREVA